jgi:hypothetical protein
MRRATIAWLVVELAAIAAGISLGIWIFDTVAH